MQTLDLLIWSAALCGAVSAILGNRTALVLVGLFAVAKYMQWTGAAFDPLIWIMWDANALLAILIFAAVRRNFTVADAVVVALYPVAWIGYFFDPLTCYYIGASVVIIQFLTVLPVSIAHRRIWRREDRPPPSGGPLLRALATRLVWQ